MQEKRVESSCLHIREQIVEFQEHIRLTGTYWTGKAAEIHCEIMNELLEAMLENVQRIEEGEKIYEHR